ncbi:MAG: bifunctional methionine sulfoxide reductase B/A protein [Bdellovibrionales bacterium]|nr:bifunctional methionine sulfoxide reductase B/A protein [Bdellovibrionales bacterium]
MTNIEANTNSTQQEFKKITLPQRRNKLNWCFIFKVILIYFSAIVNLPYLYARTTSHQQVTPNLEIKKDSMSTNEPWLKYKKPSRDELKKILTAKQYSVTQEEDTEAPFKNDFWNHHEPGIYIDIESKAPLFSSTDKFDSGTGWPSFTKPISDDFITLKKDRKFILFGERVEVRSKYGQNHLGHVFDDGPKPTNKRYCINSASLQFIPWKDLKEKGYGKYLYLFTTQPEKNSSHQKEHVPTATEDTAILAGGCFWGMEELIRKQPGVLRTQVGYSGGNGTNPSYEIVKTGLSGHAESIKIIYDKNKTSYENLLRFFFRIHDPTTKNQQGNDIGTQYRSAIFYLNEEQKIIAEKIKSEVNQSGKWPKPVVTEIVPAMTFYAAEEYHQHYLEKNPGGYTCHYIRD